MSHAPRPESGEPIPSEPVFEPDTLLSQTGGDRELTNELIKLCLAECPKLLSDIRAAVDQHDANRLRAGAHTLAGALMNFGARRAVAASQSLERISREGKLDGAEEYCRELEDAFATFQQELIAYLG